MSTFVGEEMPMLSDAVMLDDGYSRKNKIIGEISNQPSPKRLKSDEAEPPSVILRWQYLPPEDRLYIYCSYDDYDAVFGDEEDESKVKKTKLPPPGLANFIRVGEEFLSCRFCASNPDRHITLLCPNLTPELKEALKEPISENEGCKAYDPELRGCRICEKRSHESWGCPYLWLYPAGAHVGPYAEIRCMCCGEIDPPQSTHPGTAGVGWEAYCTLRDAYPCPKFKAVDEV